MDFLVTVYKKPWFSVEVKYGDTAIDPANYYFKEPLRIPYSYQVVYKKEADFNRKDVRVLSALI